jgi:glycosyltransferase involved in cell wall biosynthesis
MRPGKPLHILYIVQYFNNPDEPGGSRPYQFALRWAARGHRVTVLTSNLNHKTLATTTGTGTVAPGVEVVRVPTYNDIRGNFGKRIVNFLSFAWQATVYGLFVRDVDVVYASSTPLTTGLAGWSLGLLKRRPFYFEVRDLWPESAVVAGALTNRAVIRVAEFFERLFYRSAFKVVALTEGIRDGVIRKGKAPEDVLFVPNGMDDWMTDVEPGAADSPFDPSEHFICVYVGAHGRWNKLETLLEAAQALRGSRVRFLLVGDGDYKPALQDYAARLGLDNVAFHDAVPKNRIFDYLAHGHVAAICTWDHEFQRMVLANKVFDYMAAGCPIVAAARGETADLVSRADCGWALDPEQPQALAALLDTLSRTPVQELRRKGANGRAYVRTHYLRSQLADRLQDNFLSATA